MNTAKNNENIKTESKTYMGNLATDQKTTQPRAKLNLSEKEKNERAESIMTGYEKIVKQIGDSKKAADFEFSEININVTIKNNIDGCDVGVKFLIDGQEQQ